MAGRKELLREAAGYFGLSKGDRENTDHFAARVFYCAAGRMALASLWDGGEEGDVSLVHLKARARRLLDAYRDLYPECGAYFPDTGEMAEEIYEIYRANGLVYHSPNRVSMAMPARGRAGSLSLTRGEPLEKRQRMSGLGTYVPAPETEEEKETGKDIRTRAEKGIKIENKDRKGERTAEEVFLLEEEPLANLWERMIKKAQMQPFAALMAGPAGRESQIRFLRLDGLPGEEYWTEQPQKPAAGEQQKCISLLRVGQPGSCRFFLNEIREGRLFASPLPGWRGREPYLVRDPGGERDLVNACLSCYGLLPPSTYEEDGETVHLSFGILPGKRDLDFWKLYTWGESQMTGDDRHRLCSREVFDPIRRIMEKRGYRFVPV